MKHVTLILALSLPLLSGCGDMLQRFKSDTPAATAAIAPSAAQSAAALDTTTEAERVAALAAPAAAGAQSLGTVVVGLGNVTEQGFWLRSTLVTAPGKGRVETADGQSVAVDLLPGAGGAQLSLAAFRALGLGLTDLPEVSVFAG